ncbi:hypothetical protein [Marinobacter shengliensis]|jgi:tetratricopeptide (TPR) repeat protein|uniref:hypothetical protein n=1 Tax=Marinobacter shengliensis TaxID=1389223 RepID=UPI00257342E4|nr:hypothetical protein [Marinobacter shengliensis]BEH15444.1 hypothetical protein MAALD49_28120 [Marinobacter shengliensis]
MSHWRSMPFMFRLLQVNLAILFTLFVSACGGSSGGSSNEESGQDTVVVAGIVTDPAIVGAAVRLVDGRGNALTRIQITDQTGQFSFQLPSSVDLAGARAVAVGGRDAETGQDLQGITLEARLRVGIEVMVTPLTTLALAYEREGGTLAGFASMLGLTEQELESDPANSAEAQRASMLLTELMVAMKGAADSTSSLLDKLQMASGDLSNTADLLVADTDLPASVVSRLEAVQSRINALDSLAEAPADAAAMVRELNRLNIRNGVANYLKNNLDFQPATESEQANVDALADAIFGALNQRGLPADSAALLNIARYVVVINALSAEAIAAADFAVPQPIDPENLLGLLADTEVVDSTLPLAVGEELGDDNAARVEYFFRSDLSPYYRAARLFDGVIDDQIMDPVYADIAVGQAAAGLVEQARLTAESSIFQKVEKFNTYRRVGEQLRERGDAESAIALWQKALADFLSYLEAKGVENLSAEDAIFLSSLSEALRAAGRPELADDAFATVDAYLSAEANPNGQLTTAYRLLMGAIESKAGELVETLRSGTGSESDALSAVQLLEQVVFGAGQFYSRGAPLAGFCYNFRTLNLQSAADYYEQIGRTEDAVRMLDEYERLLRVDCNWKWARNMADDFAPIYGKLGLLDRLEETLVAYVEPLEDGVRYANDARLAAQVYVVRDAAIAGDVEAAIQLVAESQPSLIQQVSTLTFTGTGANFEGRTGLAILLSEAGYPETAKIIADHVMEIVLSDEYLMEVEASLENLNENATRPSQFIGQGCRKISALYHWLGYPIEAQNAMAGCESRAKTLFAGSSAPTIERAETHELLAEGYQWIGDTEKSRGLLETAVALVDVYSDPGKRAYEKQVIALLHAGNGDLTDALNTMVSARTDLALITTLGGSQAEILGAVKRANTLSETYLEIANIVRGRLAHQGIGAGSQPIDAVKARQAVRSLWLENDSASGWPGTMIAIDQLNDPDVRQQYRNYGIHDLAAARYFEDAEAQARGYDLPVDRNKALSLIARVLTSYDDYPGSEAIRFDFDKDGLPDFYSPTSTQQERDALAVSLDDDIDGDGIANAMDATPYCSVCEL